MTEAGGRHDRSMNLPTEVVESSIEISAERGKELVHFGNIVFESFRFSQGDPDVQKRILSQIFSDNESLYPPRNSQEENYMSDRIKEKIGRFAHADKVKRENDRGHSGVTPTQIEEELLNLEAAVYNTPSDNNKRRILNQLMRRDWKYYNEPEERWLSDVGPRHNPKDAWKSYVVEYILEEKKTRLREYDDLMGALRQEVERMCNDPADEYEVFQLQRIINMYNKKHPDKPDISLPTYETIS